MNISFFISSILFSSSFIPSISEIQTSLSLLNQDLLQSIFSFNSPSCKYFCILALFQLKSVSSSFCDGLALLGVDACC